MSNSIWHDKNEKPVKVLYKNYIIITKWGSVYGESDVDSGCFIETDWAYLEDILTQADKAERLQKAVDLTIDYLEQVATHAKTEEDNFAVQVIKRKIDEIKQTIEG